MEDEDGRGDGTARVDAIMRRTQNCQWLGLRYMYVSLGPVSWAVGGPHAFLVVSALLVAFFVRIDREPPVADARTTTT